MSHPGTDRLKITVPSFSSEELTPLLELPDGPLGRLGHAQKFMLDLLRDLDGTDVTLHRIAWLALWSRGWQLLAPTKDALAAESRLVLVIHNRAATELYLHSQLLIEPILSSHRITQGKSQESPASAVREALDRLSGYAAWCLTQDQDNLAKARRNLKEVYDGSDARQIDRDPSARARHIGFFGHLEVENQHELDQQRLRHESLIDAELAWITLWLATPDIQKWVRRFKPSQASSSQYPTIYELLGGRGRSVRRRLQELDVGFAYDSYSEASQLLHGSTAIGFIRRTESTLSPDFGQTRGDEDALAVHIADQLVKVSVNLDWLRRKAWPVEAA